MTRGRALPPRVAPDAPAVATARQSVVDWFDGRGWVPFAFQTDTWDAYLDGGSGLVNVPTGAGKTWAAWGGPLIELLAEHAVTPEPSSRRARRVDGLRVLYLSPLRAVARDIELALRAPLDALAPDIRVEGRTGDTASSLRARQRRVLPPVLVTTPESLSLLLSYDDAPARFAGLRAVIADEWHELMGSKRGIQVELALARLRRFAPDVRTWALSATIANLDVAAKAAVGVDATPTLVQADIDRPVEIDVLLPEDVGAFPWAGHLGIEMLDPVVEWLDPDVSTLVFTNARSQAEQWAQAIVQARPSWASRVALHHGSLERADREVVEAGLKSGELTIVVCTSSLDLGVDFGPVDRVMQIGSPRGVARLLQRAGRSGHRPGATSRITCVPTHGVELLEIAAIREAVERGDIEGRLELAHPLDVLTQHLVTCALGGGFTPDGLLDEVRTAWAYRNLTASDFSWALELVTEGGKTLRAYDEYRKVEPVDGRFVVPREPVARLHRMNIGTIISDPSVTIAFRGGRSLGTVEERFVARMKPGDRFVFAGRVLELVRFSGVRAVVKAAKGRSNHVPRWGGGRLPISDPVSRALRRYVAEARVGAATGPEREAVQPLLDVQLAMSDLPDRDELLVETTETRDGWHLFVFPFEGWLVHEGLAALIALRASRVAPTTFTMSSNDYGFELVAADPYPFADVVNHALFTTDDLDADIAEAVHVAELQRRQFRVVSRVAMLVPQNRPGKQKGMKYLQTSSDLLFDVFKDYDPDNLLLAQAEREVYEQHFERDRLAAALERIADHEIRFVTTERPSPLAFPLVIERVRARVSSETLAQRLARLRGV